MRRLLFIAGLIFFITSCQVQVSVSVPEVEISPSSTVLATGAAQTFTATVTDSSGVVTWTTDAPSGSLSATSGDQVIFTAPGTAGSYDLTASVSGTAATDTATITVVASRTVGTDPNTALVADEDVSADDSNVYAINVPSGLSTDVVYFELANVSPSDADITLVLGQKASDGSVPVEYQSSDARFFSRPSSSAGSSLDTQGIAIDISCRGPCIILDYVPGTYYVEVRNSGSSTASYDLFSFTDAYQDEGEPGNDDCGPVSSTGISIDPNDEDQGAIETIGDVDCYDSGGDVTSVTFAGGPNLAFGLVATVYSADGATELASLSAAPGGSPESVTLTPARTVIVKVEAAEDRAGPSQNSQYEVAFD